MLQYKVSDLVKQARSKADLVNSDFITHEDDINIINDIWLDMYQKAIDAGEKFFLKTIDAEDGMELPEDFFQLYEVYNDRGIQIPRRSLSEINRGFTAYEIENNRLYLKNINSAVKIKYFPKPATLTYPFKPRKYSLDGAFIVGKGSKVYSSTGVFDLETQEFEAYHFNESDTGSQWYLFQVYDDYIVVSDKPLNNDKTVSLDAVYKVYDIQTLDFVISLYAGQIPIQDINGKLYIYKYAYNTAFDLQNNSIEIPESPSPDNKFYSNMVLIDNTISNLGGYFNFWEENGSMVFTDTDNLIKRYYPLDNELEPLPFTQRGVLLEDDPISGKGIWFNNTLYSTSKDMLLNYPNNLFFSAIAYRLAVDYKIKQNEDAAQLSARAEEAMYSYFDSLTQDDNEPVRIKNVY